MRIFLFCIVELISQFVLVRVQFSHHFLVERKLQIVWRRVKSLREEYTHISFGEKISWQSAHVLLRRGGRSRQKSRHFHYLESKCVTGGGRSAGSEKRGTWFVWPYLKAKPHARDAHGGSFARPHERMCEPDGSQMYSHTLSTFLHPLK